MALIILLSKNTKPAVERSFAATMRTETLFLLVLQQKGKYHCLREAKLCIKDREREDELSQYYIYTKTPKTKVNLSDYCQADKPPQKGEDGESICPVTAKKEALYILCSGTDFMEVITGVLQKKPKVTNKELLEALNDYLQTRNL